MAPKGAGQGDPSAMVRKRKTGTLGREGMVGNRCKTQGEESLADGNRVRSRAISGEGKWGGHRAVMGTACRQHP